MMFRASHGKGLLFFDLYIAEKVKSKIRSSRVAADVLFKAAFHEKVLSRAKRGKDFQRRTKQSGSKKAPSKQTEPIYRFSLTLYGAWQSPQNESDSLRLLD